MSENTEARLRAELTEARAITDLWKDGVKAAGQISRDQRRRAERAEAELAALKDEVTRLRAQLETEAELFYLLRDERDALKATVDRVRLQAETWAQSARRQLAANEDETNPHLRSIRSYRVAQLNLCTRSILRALDTPVTPEPGKDPR
jgi:hypothetical protein